MEQPIFISHKLRACDSRQLDDIIELIQKQQERMPYYVAYVEEVVGDKTKVLVAFALPCGNPDLVLRLTWVQSNRMLLIDKLHERR